MTGGAREGPGQANGTSAGPATGPGPGDGTEQLPAFVEEVLDVVEAVPPGRVLSYGDVAELVGRHGPRAVGRALAEYGAAVPWWRVLRADGSPAPPVAERALAHYRAEGTPLRADGRRVDMARARWSPDA